MNQLFNDRALKQRHRSGDQNGPVTLLTPPLRATLGLGALIALAGGLWATFARIPVSVQGSGVLLPVSTINASLSGPAAHVGTEAAVRSAALSVAPRGQLPRRHR